MSKHPLLRLEAILGTGEWSRKPSSLPKPDDPYAHDALGGLRCKGIHVLSGTHLHLGGLSRGTPRSLSKADGQRRRLISLPLFLALEMRFDSRKAKRIQKTLELAFPPVRPCLLCSYLAFAIVLLFRALVQMKRDPVHRRI